MIDPLKKGKTKHMIKGRIVSTSITKRRPIDTALVLLQLVGCTVLHGVDVNLGAAYRKYSDRVTVTTGAEANPQS